MYNKVKQNYSLLYLSCYSCYLIFEFRRSEKTAYNELYDTINIISILIFLVLLGTLIMNRETIYQITTAIIYILYSVNDLANTCSTDEYKQSRTVMWLLTSPLLVQQYLHIHNMKWWDIKLQLHVIAQFMYCFPSIRQYIFIPACILEAIFTYYLFTYRHLPQTKLCLYIWLAFSLGIIAEHFDFIANQHSPLIFKMMDIMGKGVWLLNINEPKLTEIIPNDIHSLRLMGGIQQFINEFTRENQLSKESLSHINHLKKLMLKDIKIDTTMISANLLEIILPYGLDKQYLLNTNKPKKYKEIVVLMTDIVGYTGLSLLNDESNIYRMLHNLYLIFDTRVTKKACIQKIETIGDAYMAVGDLSEQTDTITVIKDMMELAQQFINDVEYINITSISSMRINIRIGISMGPVVIGVLGKTIPRMCVVGHTVNLASRLQSSTDPQTIQMSMNVFEHLSDEEKEKYNYHKRNEVDLKHIGKVDTVVCTF
jgi:class 3 adenylate cyclase